MSLKCVKIGAFYLGMQRLSSSDAVHQQPRLEEGLL